MGQYRQWLHYREVEQDLHAQIQLLTSQMTQLQEQADLLKDATVTADNSILQALFHDQTLEVPLLSPPEPPVAEPSPQQGESDEHASEQALTTVSPALFAWGRLPNFDSQEVPTYPAGADPSQHLPTTPRPDLDLLPQDMVAFFDEHAQTAPQVKLPWWLRKTVTGTISSDGKTPIDQQSIRTNRLVQRWFERWGRYSHSSEQHHEDGLS